MSEREDKRPPVGKLFKISASIECPDGKGTETSRTVVAVDLGRAIECVRKFLDLDWGNQWEEDGSQQFKKVKITITDACVVSDVSFILFEDF